MTVKTKTKNKKNQQISNDIKGIILDPSIVKEKNLQSIYVDTSVLFVISLQKKHGFNHPPTLKIKIFKNKLCESLVLTVKMHCQVSILLRYGDFKTCAVRHVLIGIINRTPTKK
jgi:hypothetical protein